MVLIAIVGHAVAVFKFAIDGEQTFLWLSIASGVVNLWSYGIMTNFRADEKAPAFPTVINLATFVTGAAFADMGFRGGMVPSTPDW